MAKRSLRRRWYLDHQGIRRRRLDDGFSFELPDGSAVSDEKTLDRIRRLRIPPAWEDVRIARGENAPLQALGVDKRGRTQYLYHSRFRQQRDEEKFLRVVKFGEALPRLRRRVQKDLSSPELTRDAALAAIVRLIDQGLFRVGNDKSALTEQTYGLTTIQSEHVKVAGSKVSFEFTGKWQKKQRRAVTDPAVATVIRRMRRTRVDQKLFRFRAGRRTVDLKDRHVNEYIQRIIGPEYSTKDFRTWGGTLLCSMALAILGQAETKKERKKRIKQAIESTAAALGNTPAVCRSSYICPRLLDDYLEGTPLESPRKLSGRSRPIPKLGLSPEEKALIKFFRETIADRRKSPRAA
jgi:DNA topoisomerase I